MARQSAIASWPPWGGLAGGEVLMANQKSGEENQLRLVVYTITRLVVYTIEVGS